MIPIKHLFNGQVPLGETGRARPNCEVWLLELACPDTWSLRYRRR